MHGLIFHSLKKYVIRKLGAEAWGVLSAQVGAEGGKFLVTQSYPDAMVLDLARAVGQRVGMTEAGVLEEFGRFIMPDLASTYRSLIQPSWRTLDLIEHTESTIHKAVRTRTGAQPPTLKISRLAPDRVIIEYSSKRRMCSLAVGMIRGTAQLYDERIHLVQQTCMHIGNPTCTIVVTTL